MSKIFNVKGGGGIEVDFFLSNTETEGEKLLVEKVESDVRIYSHEGKK